MRLTKNDFRTRQAIAQEAAQIMSEECVRDYHLAKNKAAFRLGYDQKVSLPSNEEVHLALIEYLRVFKAEAQAKHINRLRGIACEAMRFLKQYEPRLVGSVLNGTSDHSSGVHLHLFADTAEEVMMFLMDRGIPYEMSTSRVRYHNGHEELPSIHFTAENIMIDLTLFPVDSMRHPPKSPIDGKPMRRASLDKLEKLIQKNDLLAEFSNAV